MSDDTKSYWLASIERNHYETLTPDKIKTDVVIIGAGITGITTAYLLAKDGIQVTILEANEMASGTTGHTTAKITAQHGAIYDELIQSVGLNQAKQYFEANHHALHFIKQLIEKEKIDCGYTEESAYLYGLGEDEGRILQKEYEAYEKLQITGELSHEAPLPFPINYALKMPNQAHFHPGKYCQQLLQLAIEKGVQVYEHTSALRIEYNHKPTVITTNGKRIICNKIVMASHYPIYNGDHFYPAKMYAERSYVIAVKTKKYLEEGMYISVGKDVHSIRKVNINRIPHLLIAGGNHRTGENKDNEAPVKQLIDFADRHFQVKSIPYTWSAQDYTTLDKIPYIGAANKNNQDIYVATGYRKWGMTNGTNAALLLKDLIKGNENEYEALFSPARKNKINPQIQNYVKYNTEVAKILVTGKIASNKNQLDDLQTDDAIKMKQNGQRIGVYKDITGKMHAVETACTHMRCEVEWNRLEKSWDCPCHGSRFTYKGDVMNGPAKKPLKTVKLL